MRTSNPLLNSDTFSSVGIDQMGMTIRGTSEKALGLLMLVVCSAAYTWNLHVTGGNAMPWLIAGGLGGFILALITSFKPAWSPITAPVYAILEGLFLGVLSAIFNNKYPGIVVNAVMLSFGVMFLMLAAYRFNVIRATPKFQVGLMIATGSIMVIYLLTMVLRMFSVSVPYIHDNGMIGIGFSLFVVAIAALNFIMDFEMIKQGEDNRAPAYMEWYGAFGLLVTLVWLYVELLRLLSKLRSR